MHHLANSMTKQCHGREQGSAGWEGFPMYDCSGEDAVFIIVSRGGDYENLPHDLVDSERLLFHYGHA